jgi:hypothetical protein
MSESGNSDVPRSARGSWRAAVLRVGLEYAFWFGAALLLKSVLSAWVSVPYPNPLWIPVVMLALQHGLLAGLTAALLAAVLQFAPGLPPPLLAEDLYAYVGRIAFEPIAWTAVALFVGQVRSREIRNAAALQARLAERTLHADGVTELSMHLRQRVETLERQIAANADASLADVAEAIISLDHAGWETFPTCLRRFILLMTGAAEFTVYLLGESGLYPAFVSEGELARPADGGIERKTPLFAAIFDERRVLSATNPAAAAVLGNVGIMAGPLLDSIASNQVSGMLVISGASADDLPEDIERRFALACSEISRLVGRIRLMNTWHDATNGHLRPVDDSPAPAKDAQQSMHAGVASGQSASLQ